MSDLVVHEGRAAGAAAGEGSRVRAAAPRDAAVAALAGVGRLRPVLSLLASLYLTILLCLVVWVAVPVVAFGWRPQVVLSDSMEPALRTGDVILVADPSAAPAIGAIVLFDDPVSGDAIVHRVVDQDAAGGAVTKGDANLTADPRPLRPEDLRGEGRLLVPLVGAPAAWFQNGAMVEFSVWACTVIAALALARRPRRRAGTSR
jgi:signal peptidase I